MKKPEYAPPKAPRAHQMDPLQLLDYRCHLPNGKQALGTDYPKPVSGTGPGGTSGAAMGTECKNMCYNVIVACFAEISGGGRPCRQKQLFW